MGPAVALLIGRCLWEHPSPSLDSHWADCCTEETWTSSVSSDNCLSRCSYEFRELYDLSLLENPPVAKLDMAIVSFLSLGIMTGRETEVGMARWGELSLTVKSAGQQRDHPSTSAPGFSISCCKLTLRERCRPDLRHGHCTLVLKFLGRTNERCLYINTWNRHGRRSKSYIPISRNNTHFQAWWKRVFTALMDDCSAAWKKKKGMVILSTRICGKEVYYYYYFRIVFKENKASLRKKHMFIYIIRE